MNKIDRRKEAQRRIQARRKAYFDRMENLPKRQRLVAAEPTSKPVRHGTPVMRGGTFKREIITSNTGAQYYTDEHGNLIKMKTFDDWR